MLFVDGAGELAVAASSGTRRGRLFCEVGFRLSKQSPLGGDCRVAAPAQVRYSWNMKRSPSCSYLRIRSATLPVPSLDGSDQR